MIAKAHFYGDGLVLLLLLLAGGCTDTPPISPQVDTTWSISQHYDLNPNTLLANTDLNEVDVNEVLHLEVAVLPLHVLPDRLLNPAGPYIRTMTLNPNPQFVTPVLRYSEGARMGPVEDADTFVREIQKSGYGRVQLLQRIHAVLPAGVRWQLNITESIFQERLTFEIVRPLDPNGTLESVLSHTVPERSTPVTERILFRDGLLSESPCWAWVMPCHQSTDQVKAVALIARLRLPPQAPEDSEGYPTALTECREQIQAQVSLMSQTEMKLADPWQEALELLRWPARHRKTLRYMTQGSPFAHELVLTGPRPMIRALAEALIVADEQGLLPEDHAPWHLEKMAYSVVLQSWEAGDLTPSVQALLTVHTGQVGRDLNTLKTVLKQAAGPQVLSDLLIQENLIFLQDISPAARMRAYQWLQKHQAAPAHFNPLASAQERRAALAEPYVTDSSSQEPSLDR